MDEHVKRKIRKTGWVFFFVYIALLVYCLFFSERYGRGGSSEYHYNLELFREINRFIKYRHKLSSELFYLNIVGNVVGFMPFGFFIPMLSRKRNFFQVLFLSFELTLTIEVIQLITKVGTFDVDDLFLNTLGGVLGYICYAIFHGIYRIKYSSKRKKHK